MGDAGYETYDIPWNVPTEDIRRYIDLTAELAWR
jgi:hypothetical protein